MPSKPKYVFIFDMMRHRSHLFFRYLGTHPDLKSLWHPYVAAGLFGPEEILQHLKLGYSDDEWTGGPPSLPPAGGTEDTFEDADRNLQHAITEAENDGKILVANEHLFVVLKQKIMLGSIRNEDIGLPFRSNPTVIPDQIFNTLTPIFVIRNPVFMLASYYHMCIATDVRPSHESWKMATDLKMQRCLFDYFRERDGKAPIVVDGDDVVWSTDRVGDGLCQALDLNPRGLSTKWEAVPEKERHENFFVQQFLQVINDSTGIQPPSVQRPDDNLNTAYARWLDDFGESVANHLKDTAKENMPHYEYMAQFKV